MRCVCESKPAPCTGAGQPSPRTGRPDWPPARDELIEEAANEREAREAMLLTPYVFMYAFHAAIEGAKAVDDTGLERMRDGVFKR